MYLTSTLFLNSSHPGDDPELIISEFLRSDINIIVASSPDQLEKPNARRIIDALSSKPKLFMIIDGPTDPSTSAAIPYSYRDLLKPFQQTDGDSRLYVVSSEHALNTQDSFHLFHLDESRERLPASSRAATVDRFHTNLISSGIPRLSERIFDILQGFNIPSELPPLRMTSVLYTASSVLRVSKLALDDAKRETDLVLYRIQGLRSIAKETARHYRAQILSDGVVPISNSTRTTKRNVELYLGGLPWWKLPWRVDDFPSDVSQILTATYGKDLEQHVGTTIHISL